MNLCGIIFFYASMPPTPEGRMSTAGDKLMRKFSADDFYL